MTCFIDTEREDVDAAAAFYGGLFGWSFDDLTPPGSPDRFLMAQLDGLTVAGIGSPLEGAAGPAWNTYVAVEDADAIVPKVEAAGGAVVVAPFDVGPAGRMAVFADPEGAQFRVWQAGRTHGVQLVNAPGSWNWSDLETRDIDAAKAFYGAVFGWQYQEVDFGEGPSAMIRVAGYGDHLEQLTPGHAREPQVAWARPRASRTRSAGCSRPQPRTAAPAGSSRSRSPTRTTPPAARGELGGTVLVEPFDVPYVRIAVLRDPEGVTFTIGQFQPPEH